MTGCHRDGVGCGGGHNNMLECHSTCNMIGGITNRLGGHLDGIECHSNIFGGHTN